MQHRQSNVKAAPSPGVTGTLGGVPFAVGSRPGRRQMAFGDEVYLWILVAIEVAAIGWLRNMFSRYHGG